MKVLMALAAVAAFGFAGGARAAEVARTYDTPTSFIARAIVVPAGYETVYLSGIMPDPPAAPTPWADAETQAANVFAKIGAVLKAHGLSEADVVSMTIYMAAAPGERMDFDGMMKSYRKYYGSETQPNRPARSTVQVANLGIAGALMEIEVTAVRKPR